MKFLFTELENIIIKYLGIGWIKIQKMKRFLKIVQIFRTNGFVSTFRIIHKKLLTKKITNYKFYKELFYDKCGIEIGGPSAFFKKELPIYGVIKSLDGVNFSSSTIWGGEIREGEFYKYGTKERGYQFICDAVNLDRIESGKYSFVLSCNNLEHIANPVKALTEWMRILKPGGLLLLVLPNKESNFDHNRSTTNIEHLLEDFNNNISEGDLSHLDEILVLHDLSLDAPSGDFDNFKKRSINNYQNRCLHHHVYDMNLLERIFRYLNIELILKDSTKTDFIIIGKKYNHEFSEDQIRL